PDVPGNGLHSRAAQAPQSQVRASRPDERRRHGLTPRPHDLSLRRLGPRIAPIRLAMTSTQTHKTNRRKQQRHPRLLRISWRMLGNRDFRFGEAPLKDISTGGLAMFVDTPCRKGTVVIVQMEGLPEPFFGPWLLQAAWSKDLSAEKGKPAYLMGCSF